MFAAWMDVQEFGNIVNIAVKNDPAALGCIVSLDLIVRNQPAASRRSLLW
jgi:hypothetical protein